MLTGARCGEARTATFDQLNLDLAIWTKQAAYTKQRRVHRVPISHEAVALIRLRRDAVPNGCPFLPPVRARSGQIEQVARLNPRPIELKDSPRCHPLPGRRCSASRRGVPHLRLLTICVKCTLTILHDLHSIFPKRLKCCSDPLKPPRKADLR
jgi:integrase